jgi:hypothetical protein
VDSLPNRRNKKPPRKTSEAFFIHGRQLLICRFRVDLSIQFGVVSIDGPLDRVVDFPSMNGDFLGSFNSESNLVATDLDHNDGDFVVNDDAFVLFS